MTNRYDYDKLNATVPQEAIPPLEQANAQHIQSGEDLNFMPIDYLPILILVIVATAFACIALIVPALLGPRRPTETKLLPYESGKIPFGDAWRRFPVKYYLTAMLFIVLDIAVIFLYPWATVFRDLKVFGLIAMAIFVTILLVGYVYIWKKEALEWD